MRETKKGLPEYFRETSLLFLSISERHLAGLAKHLDPTQPRDHLVPTGGHQGRQLPRRAQSTAFHCASYARTARSRSPIRKKFDMPHYAA
jgi:hypothetical protein